ncbi:MAG: hypothetical protein H0X26_02870 [Alphaproteobacteria bacterium]|nr:hypothetical protein [Alphaproteobacteria bacterium]
MFSTPDFWVFVAFVLFLGFFGKRAMVFLAQHLDQHRQKIAQQLEEAQHLHDEALSLLNSYKKKHEDAVEQANQIMARAEREALAFQKSSEIEFQKLLAQKEKALLDRIAMDTEATTTKLRNQVVDEAFAIVENLLSKDLKERGILTKTSLREISGLVLKAKTERN